MKNATIQGRLFDLLEVLDARKVVNIFELVEIKDDKIKSESIKYAYVYEILGDMDFIKTYKNYEIVGIDLGFTTNILIKEA